MKIHFGWAISLGMAMCISLLIWPHTSSAAQKYAPVVGRWQVKVQFADSTAEFDFETLGEGVYGYGHGSIFLLDPQTRLVATFPAAWDNHSVETIHISGEISLPAVAGKQRTPGTLILRIHYEPKKGYVGTAFFIGEDLTQRKGTIEMKRLKGPEELLKAKGIAQSEKAWKSKPPNLALR